MRVSLLVVLVPEHDKCPVHSSMSMQLRERKDGTPFFGCPLFSDPTVKCRYVPVWSASVWAVT